MICDYARVSTDAQDLANPRTLTRVGPVLGRPVGVLSEPKRASMQRHEGGFTCA